jgi:hypothetical protein
MYKEMSVDWEEYRETFPDRYLKPSVFDRVFNKMVQQRSAVAKRRLRILDIGGGLCGNSFQAVGDYYLLDTGISSLVEKNTIQVSWDEVLGIDYDFIRMRGSIAYLSEEELGVVASMLCHEAVVAFNTFRTVGGPIKVREYSSKNGGGTEIIEADLKNGVIKHILNPDGVDGVFVSHFYIRTVEEYFDLLDPFCKCSVVQGWRPPNSIWVTMGRGHSVRDLGL